MLNSIAIVIVESKKLISTSTNLLPVMSCYREPLPGWIGNYNGPILLLVYAALGFFRIGYHKNEPCDWVPVDMSSNMGITIIWDLIVNKYVHEHPAQFLL